MMKTLPTRWFELSYRELKSILIAAALLLLFLAATAAWRRAMYSEEFIVHNAPEVLQAPPRIDINASPAHELRFLPGIGETRARDIIRYRDEHGPFESVDDLRKIEGIGPDTIRRIRPYAICLPQHGPGGD